MSTGQTTQTITVSEPGEYTVTVTNAQGCTGTDVVTVFASGGGWATAKQSKSIANDGASYDYFGRSVAISGNTAIVSAPLDDYEDLNNGSAYIFARNASGLWQQAAKLTAADGAFNDQFGISVAVSGNTAVVGAPYGGTSRGSAYIFERNAAGLWQQVIKLTAADGASYDNFGSSVAISGNTAVVGALGDDDDVFSESGSTYFFSTDFNSTLGSDTVVCADQFVLDAGAGFAAYLWSTGETTQAITVAQTDTVSVLVTDAQGCQAADMVVVELTTDLPRGVARRVAVYPNPSQGAFTVALSGGWGAGAEVSVLDALGRRLYGAKLRLGRQEVSPGLAAGVYWLRVRDAHHTEVVRLVVH